MVHAAKRQRDATALGFTVERDQHLHRAEDLFLRQPVFRRQRAQQRGRDVAATVWKADRQRRLGGDGQATVAGQRQVADDDVALAG